MPPSPPRTTKEEKDIGKKETEGITNVLVEEQKNVEICLVEGKKGEELELSVWERRTGGEGIKEERYRVFGSRWRREYEKKEGAVK